MSASGEDETIGLPPVNHLNVALEDADLVAQHQQLSLISGPGAVRGLHR